MAGETVPHPGPADSAARRTGRAEGLATAALATSIVCFFNLLGAEKALLAIVLAVLALRSASSSAARSRSWIALGFALLYLCIFVLVIILFHDKFHHLLQSLHELG